MSKRIEEIINEQKIKNVDNILDVERVSLFNLRQDKVRLSNYEQAQVLLDSYNRVGSAFSYQSMNSDRKHSAGNTAKVLIEICKREPKILTKQNKNGLNLLHKAGSLGLYEVFDFAKSINSKGLSQQNNHGQNPVMSLAKSGPRFYLCPEILTTSESFLGNNKLSLQQNDKGENLFDVVNTSREDMKMCYSQYLRFSNERLLSEDIENMTNEFYGDNDFVDTASEEMGE